MCLGCLRSVLLEWSESDLRSGVDEARRETGQIIDE